MIILQQSRVSISAYAINVTRINDALADVLFNALFFAVPEQRTQLEGFAHTCRSTSTYVLRPLVSGVLSRMSIVVVVASVGDLLVFALLFDLQHRSALNASH